MKTAPGRFSTVTPPGKSHVCYDAVHSLTYHDRRSGFGHDKSQAILPYRRLPDPPTVFFFGDGVSGAFIQFSLRSQNTEPDALSVDMSAARHADVLFVKQKPGADNDLAAYCTREGIQHVLFEDFDRALGVIKKVVDGEFTVKDALAVGTA